MLLAMNWRVSSTLSIRPDTALHQTRHCQWYNLRFSGEKFPSVYNCEMIK